MSRPYPFVGTALAAFESEFESELGFKEGTELIILSTKGHQGWWLGRHGEKQGLVPATYVKPRALQPATIRADFQAEGPSELSTQQGDRVGVIDTGSNDGWAVVVKAESCSGLPGPGLVPADWLKLSQLAEALANFAPEAEVELALEAGQKVWIVQEVDGG